MWADPLIEEAGAREACQWVLKAVGYVAAYAESPRVTSIHYRLFLVPEGQTAEIRSLSWRPLGHLRPLYLAHWQQDLQRTQATVVGTFAHEALHLDMFMLGVRKPRSEDEDIADLAGACARLEVAGRINSRNYQSGVPRNPEEFPDRQLNPSMMASGAFAAKIAPLFNQNGLILANSSVGHAFKKHCSTKLSKLFLGEAR